MKAIQPKYKRGDKVIIIGNTEGAAGHHLFATGAECEVLGTRGAFPGLYELAGYSRIARVDTTQFVAPTDFKLVTAYPSLQAYRDRVTSMDEGDE